MSKYMAIAILLTGVLITQLSIMHQRHNKSAEILQACTAGIRNGDVRTCYALQDKYHAEFLCDGKACWTEFK